MDVAIPKSNDSAAKLPALDHEGGAGTSRGVNIAPGDQDDGWVVPGPVMLHDGTRVQLYKDGEALHIAYEAIKHAKRRICLEVYIFADDPTGQAFAELLCEKARQGVNVYVIYDSFGVIGSDRKIFDRMRRAGAHVEEFHPIRPWEGRFSWRPFNRDHRKLLLVDDDIAGLGGLNIATEYAGSWVVKSSEASCNAWRDTAIGLVGPGAHFLLHAFARTWHYIHHGGRIGGAEYLHGIDADGKSLAPVDRPRRRRGTFGLDRTRPAARLDEEFPRDLSILASVPTMASPLRPLLHRLFREATKSIQLTMAYFAPDDALIESLCDAAKRGVKVQLMLPGQCDIRALLIAARSFYATLLECGVEVFERQGCILHAKTMVIDGRISVVGSTNLDYRSIEYNCELSAVIRSEALGRQMQDLFANDIGFAKKISLNVWRRRRTLDRVVQWTVSRARYLL